MKRKPEQEESSGYSWMDTYGDMVTLLLCFFVLIYSFSSMDAAKWQELVGAFTGVTGSAEIDSFDVSTIREQPITEIDAMINTENREESDVSSDETDIDSEDSATNVEQQEINETFDELYENIRFYIGNNGLEGKLSVSRTDDVIILRFNEIALFRSGYADIITDSAETLIHIIQIIDENISSISMVNIEGHTDNVPIGSADFTDNWDLSVKRATNTLRLVLEMGLISEDKLSAVGYGEYQPVATNDTPEGRAQNRRVDFVLNKLRVT